MFQHILVPVDGSATALLAVKQAGQLAKAIGSRVTLVHVIDVYPFTGAEANIAAAQTEYLKVARTTGADAVAKAQATLAAEGVAGESKVVEGHAVHDGVIEAAAAVGADLIVIGSHGRRGVQRLLLGSTTQRVLSHAAMPVLVVRGAD
jgi:nucleotide-binding universal stress UspA family protein